MRLRDWPIWLKLIALLLVPIVSAAGLWVYELNTKLADSRQFNTIQGLYDELGVQDFTLAGLVEAEEAATAVYVGSGHQQGGPQMQAARAQADAAIAKWRQVAPAGQLPENNGLFHEALDSITGSLNQLSGVRASVDGSSLNDVIGSYTNVVFGIYQGAMAVVPLLTDPGLQSRFLPAPPVTAYIADLAAEESYLAGVLAEGKFGPGQVAQFTQLVGTRRSAMQYTVVTIAQRTPSAPRIDQAPPAQQLAAAEDQVMTRAKTGEAPAVSPATWSSVSQAATGQAATLLQQVGAAAVAVSPGIGHSLSVQVDWTLGLGIAILVLALLVSFLIGRNLVRKLARLRRSALELANDQLPDVVHRLQLGDRVDVATEVPPITGLGRDEIGQLGTAFNAARTTAVAVAVQQAALRHGVSRMFLNLARRSQTLVHRQLKLIDAMERREVDPDELQDLFQLDHLATRMRRHAEDLIVLSGAAPGRGWRHPVQLGEVVRGAVAEVENYAHATVLDTPEVSILGPAVGDMMHLLAELIENATSYSPPEAPVNISSHLVANGAVVEIEDGGLGIPEEDLAVLNERLANPPPFDPANSERLGLFVVSRLAARHGVEVRLRRSVYGGTTAIVLLPNTLLDNGSGDRGEQPAAVRGGEPAGVAAAAQADDDREMSWRGWFNETQRKLGVGESAGAGAPGPERLPAPERERPLVPEPRGRHVRVARRGLSGVDGLRSETASLSDSGSWTVEMGTDDEDDTRRLPAVPPQLPALPPGRPDVRAARSGGVPRPPVPPTGGGAAGAGVPRRSGDDGGRMHDGDGEALRSRPTVVSGGQTEVGLPRRVRQANLAPGLRERPAGAALEDDEELTSRSPEQIRAMMASYQIGSRRGRIESPSENAQATAPGRAPQQPAPAPRRGWQTGAAQAPEPRGLYGAGALGAQPGTNPADQGNPPTGRGGTSGMEDV